jgi:hypothetical protein
MKQMSENHSHKFSIADKEAVTVLLHKLVTRNGSLSRNVDDRKLLKALNAAARRYSQSKQGVSQAFFHGLLTGYAVGLKHK